MVIDPDQFRVAPGSKVHLDEISTTDTDAYEGGKKDANAEVKLLSDEINDLDERLYAEGKHSLLIILQGMDTSGKDGTVSHVFQRVNPQGVRVVSFKAPTELELAHDFLWRIHEKTPGKGQIVIFNRSQYEDVLIVRVHDLAPEKVWHKRYEHINDFERLLVDEGTTILKFFLHISKSEQEQRFLDRLNQPKKHWKFNAADLKERGRWNDYIKAYEDAIEMTSTDWAPWYIVPSDHKWFRNLLIATKIEETLKNLNPKPKNILSEKDVEKYRDELEHKGK